MIRITPADKYFSLCIRERANWHCERCGSYFAEGRRMGLHCSHVHGRGKWSVRFDPQNATALCYGCHRYMGSQPLQHMDWIEARLGRVDYDALSERAQDASRGRLARKSVKAIATHYRQEQRRMQALREAGDTGRIEIVGWL
jgi:hypothetical protein